MVSSIQLESVVSVVVTAKVRFAFSFCLQRLKKRVV